MPLSRISYINKDYESIRDSLITRIPLITDKWTDLTTSDLGITILELFCGISDLLIYYLDHQANEAYLQTAAERKNVMRLTRLIGYKFESLTSASADLTFSISSPLTRDVIIPKYTRLKGNNGLEYTTIEYGTIPAGHTSTTIPAKQGVKFEEIYTSNDTAYQSIKLSSDSISENTIYVYVGEGEELWTEKNTLINSGEDDKHYTREIDENNYQTLYFGNNINGKIPEGTIKIQYIISSGGSGNIGSAKVNRILDKIYDSDGADVTVTVTNQEAFTGGSDVESIDEAKVQAPAEYATQDRTVTKSDFEVLISGFPGVKQCQAVDVRSSLTMPFKYIELYVIPDIPNLYELPVEDRQISNVLKTELTEYLDEKIIVGRLFEFKNVTYVPVTINVVIYVYSSYDADTVRTNVSNSLASLFHIDNIKLGETMRYSKLAAKIQSVPGIAYVDILEPTSDLVAKYGEILTLGSAIITIGDTNL